MKTSLLDLFLQGKLAVTLVDQDQWDTLMKLLDTETSMIWMSGNRPTGFNGWEVHKEKTLVGGYTFPWMKEYRTCLMYGKIEDFPPEEGYSIVSYDEFVDDVVGGEEL